ncbi:hypothetical protein KAFR_0A03790 [Kazachstania africana CBS 2517]|uniref:ABC transporter domain-containing protein n=1 Tax=Kazachstania africana (strain ATCC 22294 / BCRC 22015 / CBS 2517 / CECT 1963 / NBRC 1671 / NRRL Y-8276) TaxID=1071382 RepID=H2AN64_KAZAF|nr:hypothetical protein KAFR_0A03790 [Kazachstania africana CBS 2517]CCF55814.1 hypothetical protein KAFR_0A03790 [Kazachstania africana CBS 2517]
MSELAIANKLQKLVADMHSHCIGLNLKDVTLKTYLNTLLNHLLRLIKSPLSQPRHKRRAQIVFLSLVVSCLSLVTGCSYFGYRIVSKCYYFFKYSNKRHEGAPLRRTRSQTLLNSGARIMYIPDDKTMNTNVNVISKDKRKKIFIPPKYDDVYEHDKYLFKAIDSSIANGQNKQSQLFYSKFLNQMNAISKILIPSIFDKNSVLLVLQIFFLIMRTWLSLFVARLDGQIVRDIISHRGRKFLLDLVVWFLIAVPASYTNSAIKLLQRKLSLNFKVNLTRYIHDMYLDDRLAFYKLMFDTKASSSVIKNIDNSITNDVSRFCDATCSVVANIAKPVIDLVFFSIYLRDNLGTVGVGGIFFNYFLTGYILRRYTPPLGKLTSASSAADGTYYNYHLNMINNSEEIAFYQGTDVERIKVQKLYETLMEAMLNVSKRKFNYNMIEDYILKYTWSGLGYVFASIPIVLSTVATGVNSEQRNMKDFIVNKRLMLSLADAGSRLMHSIKDISQLTGYTNRIFTLLAALHRVHSINFNYGATTRSSQIDWDQLSSNKDMHTANNLHLIKQKRIEKATEVVQGTVQNNFNGVRLENVDIVIPSTRAKNGTKLIKKLTFQVPPSIDPLSSRADSVQDFNEITNDISIPFLNSAGSSLLILGPNGCGKSSIQRIIAEIWPIYNKNGLLSKPTEANLLCVPQKPYFTRGGTLRDQIIYPMSSDEFFDRGLKDKLLVQVLREVKLDYLLKRDKGWSYLDTVSDWKDVLSGGEKQRMNFARIMFHKPRFVVLDEATNAISADMEDYLFNVLKRYRFNFITISQRPSLIKYHDLLLEISDDNSGLWQLQTLGTDEAITSIDNEIEEIKRKLEKVNEWKAEREELQRKLEIL